MTERSINISPKELSTLQDWISTFDTPAHTITLTVSNSSGIGPSIRADIELGNGEGRYKDLTDYSSW
jgi:hypothetical protein